MKASGTSSDIVENLLIKSSDDYLSVKDISQQVGMQQEEVQDHLDKFVESGAVHKLSNGVYLHENFIIDRERALIEALNDFHEKHPLRMGMSKEEIRSRLFKNVKMKILDEILGIFEKNIRVSGQYIHLKNFEIEYTEDQRAFISYLKNALDRDLYKPESIEEIVSKGKKVKHLHDIISNLIAEGELIKISDQIHFTKETYFKMVNTLKEAFNQEEKLALADCRNLLDTSRKYIVPIMEHFDQIGMTKRVDDYRVLK
jgi:selenocysteine-specific elongation factor